MRTEIIDLVKKDTPDWSYPELISKDGTHSSGNNNSSEILFITSYPPDECGIATYSQDLIKSLQDKFSSSFTIKVCALKVPHVADAFPDEVKCILDAANPDSYSELISVINENDRIKLVLIQHEFGLFQNIDEQFFLQFLYKLTKPIVIVFHTVLPYPNESLKAKIKNIALACESVIVMTNHAAQLLIKMYDVPLRKITVIPHGTHLVKFLDKNILKKKYKLTGKKVLSTFGLINPGKSIETTLDALPDIIVDNPEVLFLIIGKTHPGIIKQEQEKYRNMLEEKIEVLKLHQHVKFINSYLSLPDLLEYLQLTDIYLFTSKDPHQAVSGTFSYAMSCACPIISTPIPHAKEALGDNSGIIIDFQNSQQLAAAVKRLLGDNQLRATMSSNALHQMAATAWENSAIAHVILFQKITNSVIHLKYNIPKINLDHFKRLTTDFGMLQFSKANQPDLESGYTLDDNARALIAIIMHYELTNEKDDINYINIYLYFIKYCLQPKGYFLNYVNKDKNFTEQNDTSN
ncbi:MAG: glycosyltransferase, partial [Bacteroidetes bacterium]|nr:glycosyltransferase [Bacteroidota bacterium]